MSRALAGCPGLPDDVQIAEWINGCRLAELDAPEEHRRQIDCLQAVLETGMCDVETFEAVCPEIVNVPARDVCFVRQADDSFEARENACGLLNRNWVVAGEREADSLAMCAETCLATPDCVAFDDEIPGEVALADIDLQMPAEGNACWLFIEAAPLEPVCESVCRAMFACDDDVREWAGPDECAEACREALLEDPVETRTVLACLQEGIDAMACTQAELRLRCNQNDPDGECAVEEHLEDDDDCGCAGPCEAPSACVDGACVPRYPGACEIVGIQDDHQVSASIILYDADNLMTAVHNWTFTRGDRPAVDSIETVRAWRADGKVSEMRVESNGRVNDERYVYTDVGRIEERQQFRIMGEQESPQNIWRHAYEDGLIVSEQIVRPGGDVAQTWVYSHDGLTIVQRQDDPDCDCPFYEHTVADVPAGPELLWDKALRSGLKFGTDDGPRRFLRSAFYRDADAAPSLEFLYTYDRAGNLIEQQRIVGETQTIMHYSYDCWNDAPRTVHTSLSCGELRECAEACEDPECTQSCRQGARRPSVELYDAFLECRAGDGGCRAQRTSCADDVPARLCVEAGDCADGEVCTAGLCQP